jgi:hypothetical protein
MDAEALTLGPGKAPRAWSGAASGSLALAATAPSSDASPAAQPSLSVCIFLLGVK